MTTSLIKLAPSTSMDRSTCQYSNEHAYGGSTDIESRWESGDSPSNESRRATPTLPNRTHHYSHNPLRPVAHYVPRPRLHQKIKEQLHDKREQADNTRTLVVWGLGGSGKSQLVLNYVREYRRDYAAIFWLEAGQKESIERDYVQIYRQLFEPRGREVLGMEDVVSAVKSWFYTHPQIGRSLVVFDSADAIDESDDASYIDLNYYLPDAPSVDIIITTRSAQAKGMTELEAVEVGEMEESEAANLFYKCSQLQAARPAIAEEVSVITEELGKLALAITLAGSYVAATPRLRSDVRLYLPEYRARRKELLSVKPKKQIHRYGESVLSTWETSFAAVARQSAVAARLLSLLAFLNFDDIFPGLFERPAHAQGSPQDGGGESERHWQSFLSPDALMDRYTMESAFTVLQTYSLVQWREGQGGYVMHKLVHAWGSERLEEGERRQISVTALQLLVQALPSLKGVVEKIRVVPHAMANFGILSVAFHTQPLNEAIILDRIPRIGDLLHDLGRWSEQYEIQSFHLVKTRKIFGVEHPATLASVSDLARVLQDQGKYAAAEEMNRRALTGREKVLGVEHPHTLTSVSNLAMVLQNQGKYEAAEEMNRRALAGYEKMLGVEHPDTLTSVGNLALVLQDQGKYEAAEEMNRRALAGYEKVLGVEHPDTLTSVGNLALVLRDQGKYEAEEEMNRRALAGREKVLGVEHPDTLTSVGNLALVLQDQGKYEAAEEMNRRALAGREKVLGVGHPHTLTSVSNLAIVLQDQGKYEAAEEMNRRALAGYEKVLGVEHPDTLTSVSNLALVLQDQGKYEAAEEMNRRALAGREKVLGVEHPDTLNSVYCLAYLLQSQQQYEQAVILYQRALSGLQRILGPAHPIILACSRHYSSMLQEMEARR
jgi:tetratricopeptide (TPR) repeat protein